MKKLKTQLSISKWNSTEREKGITIEVKDALSGIHFLEIKISLSDFAEAITGLSHIDCISELRGLEYIGKKYEHKTMDVEIPDTYDRKLNVSNALKLAKKQCPKGWLFSSYLGSQDSFFRVLADADTDKDNKYYAKITLFRYVDVKGE